MPVALYPKLANESEEFSGGSRRHVVVPADGRNLDTESAPATVNFHRVGRFSGVALESELNWR
jgi:hypothetical protein